jgi:hypothetical protein
MFYPMKNGVPFFSEKGVISFISCNFKVGDRVSITEKTLRFINPFRDEWVAFKSGIIKKVLPVVPTLISCLYEVQFRDGNTATDVPEEYFNENDLTYDYENDPAYDYERDIRTYSNSPNESLEDILSDIKYNAEKSQKFAESIDTGFSPLRTMATTLAALNATAMQEKSKNINSSDEPNNRGPKGPKGPNGPNGPNSPNSPNNNSGNDNNLFLPINNNILSPVKDYSQIINSNDYSTSQKPDLLTLMTLNSISENIRDTFKPRTVLYNPYLDSPFLKQEIQNIGNDEDLQDNVTKYYHSKTIKWIQNEHEFAKAKKHLKFVKSKKRLPYLKKVLKSFVKKFGKNWYELRDDDTKDDVQEYIRKKLVSL